MEHTIQTESRALTFVSPAINFQCDVHGKKITANLIGEIDDPLYCCYRIKFSDGYQDNFYVLTGGFVEGDVKDKSAAYAFAIKDDLRALDGFTHDKEIHCIRKMIDGSVTNVWIIEDNTDGEQTFRIFYKGDYRFEMKKEGSKWLAKTKRVVEPEMINDELAAEIGRLIDRERNRS